MSGRLNGAGHHGGELAAAESHRDVTGSKVQPRERFADELSAMYAQAFRALGIDGCVLSLAAAGGKTCDLSHSISQNMAGGGLVRCPYGEDEAQGPPGAHGNAPIRTGGVFAHLLHEGAQPATFVPASTPRSAARLALGDALASLSTNGCEPVFHPGFATGCRIVGEAPGRVLRERTVMPNAVLDLDVREASDRRLDGARIGITNRLARFASFDNIDKADALDLGPGGAAAAGARGSSAEPGCEVPASTAAALEHPRCVIGLGGTGSSVLHRMKTARSRDSFAAVFGGEMTIAVREVLERRLAGAPGGRLSASDRVVLCDLPFGPTGLRGSKVYGTPSLAPVHDVDAAREAFLVLGDPAQEALQWGLRRRLEAGEGYLVRIFFDRRQRVELIYPEELGGLLDLGAPLTESVVAALELWAEAAYPEAAAALLPVRARTTSAQRYHLLGRWQGDLAWLERDAVVRVLAEVMRRREAAAFAWATREIRCGLVWSSPREDGGELLRELLDGFHLACRELLWPPAPERVELPAMLAPRRGVELVEPAARAVYVRKVPALLAGELYRGGDSGRLRMRPSTAPAPLHAVPDAAAAVLQADSTTVPDPALGDAVTIKFTRGRGTLAGWIAGLRGKLRKLLHESPPLLAEKPAEHRQSIVIFIDQSLSAPGLVAPNNSIRRALGAWRAVGDDAWCMEPSIVREYFDSALRPLSFQRGMRVTCREDLAADIAERLRRLVGEAHEVEHTSLRLLGELARRIAAFHVQKTRRPGVAAHAARAAWISHDALVCSQLQEMEQVERERLDKALRRLGGLLPCLYLVLDGFGAGGREVQRAVPRGEKRDERALQWSRWLASVAKIEVKTHRALDLDACLIRTPRSATIYLGDHLPPSEQEFAIFHELAHLRLGHEANTRYGLDPSRLDTPGIAKFERQEAEADALATVYRRVVRALESLLERADEAELDRAAAPPLCALRSPAAALRSRRVSV